MARRGGLGKGLGALIPAGIPEGVGGLEEIPVAAIRPNPYQPREHFDEEELASLAESIREVGILQPVLVRETDDGYELIAGERRWRAARRVGLQNIPALVRDTDDASALEHALVENVHRVGPQRARGGRGLPAAHRGLRADPRGGRDPGRAQPHRGHQHAAPPPAPADGAAARARQVADDGPRPGAARHPRPRAPGAAGASGSSPRGSRCGRSRMRCASRRSSRPTTPKPTTRRRDRRGRRPRRRASSDRRACSSSRAARRPPRHAGEGRHGHEARAGSRSSSRPSRTSSGSTRSSPSSARPLGAVAGRPVGGRSRLLLDPAPDPAAIAAPTSATAATSAPIASTSCSPTGSQTTAAIRVSRRMANVRPHGPVALGRAEHRLELGLDRVGDAEAGLGAELARREVVAAAARTGRRPGGRGRGRPGTGSPGPRWWSRPRPRGR